MILLSIHNKKKNNLITRTRFIHFLTLKLLLSIRYTYLSRNLSNYYNSNPLQKWIEKKRRKRKKIDKILSSVSLMDVMMIDGQMCLVWLVYCIFPLPQLRLVLFSREIELMWWGYTPADRNRQIPWLLSNSASSPPLTEANRTFVYYY